MKIGNIFYSLDHNLFHGRQTLFLLLLYLPSGVQGKGPKAQINERKTTQRSEASSGVRCIQQVLKDSDKEPQLLFRFRGRCLCPRKKQICTLLHETIKDNIKFYLLS